MNVTTVYEMKNERSETGCRSRSCLRANKNSVAGRIISWGSAAMMPDSGAVDVHLPGRTAPALLVLIWHVNELSNLVTMVMERKHEFGNA